MARENGDSQNDMRVSEHAASQQHLVRPQRQGSAVQKEVACEGVKAAVWQLIVDLQLAPLHICLNQTRISGFWKGLQSLVNNQTL